MINVTLGDLVSVSHRITGPGDDADPGRDTFAVDLDDAQGNRVTFTVDGAAAAAQLRAAGWAAVNYHRAAAERAYAE